VLLMIDNYDSFTYNLVQYLGELGHEVRTVRNDQITIEEIGTIAPQCIVLSPGPCTPNEAGVCLDVVQHFADRIPLLGVCLGLQCIGQAFGGRIIHAREVMHGKTSMVAHDGQGVFADLPTPYRCTRYHSLVIDAESLPDCLQVTATVAGDSSGAAQIMGIRHNSLPIEGVQFHPESVLSEHGHRLLDNFVRRVAQVTV
jgi:anthranilate synthase component II